jgi:CO/xanthine dehydrogenase FAD-binding subunit
LRPFRYHRPDNLSDILALLAEHGSDAYLLAGGTDLIVRLRQGRTARIVIDVKRAAGLTSRIAEAGGCLRVGALTVMTQLMRDPLVNRHFPALVEAASVVGSVQIRNRATLAGNICNASPAADTAPPLLVYGAVANLRSEARSRAVPVADFFTGPGRTVLERGEIVESIDLPLPPRRGAAVFGRITRRRGVDLATINLCCHVDESGSAQFAYGAVGPRPFLVYDRTGALARHSSSDAERDAAIEALVAHASPISDVRGSREYRLAMLKVMTRRTLETALSRMDSVA